MSTYKQLMDLDQRVERIEALLERIVAAVERQPLTLTVNIQGAGVDMSTVHLAIYHALEEFTNGALAADAEAAKELVRYRDYLHDLQRRNGADS